MLFFGFLRKNERGEGEGKKRRQESTQKGKGEGRRYAFRSLSRCRMLPGTVL